MVDKCPKCGCTETRQEGDCPAGNWHSVCAECGLPVSKWDKIRPCKQCGKVVDFSDPYCEHEIMEESAWRDILKRQKAAAESIVIDEQIKKAAEELGYRAAEDFRKMIQRVYDAVQLEEHLSDLDHVNQHR